MVRFNFIFLVVWAIFVPTDACPRRGASGLIACLAQQSGLAGVRGGEAARWCASAALVRLLGSATRHGSAPATACCDFHRRWSSGCPSNVLASTSLGRSTRHLSRGRATTRPLEATRRDTSAGCRRGFAPGALSVSRRWRGNDGSSPAPPARRWRRGGHTWRLPHRHAIAATTSSTRPRARSRWRHGEFLPWTPSQGQIRLIRLCVIAN